MDNQILATLEQAQETVATLKSLIEKEDKPNDEQFLPPSKSNNALSIDKSLENLYHTKFMTLSTEKLFENRGIEVFKLEDSVGLYFIVPNTRVRTAARSARLRIVKIGDEYHDGFHPPAFVQVGDWMYPLMPNSMVYKSEHNYYLFPDLISTTAGTSVGVVLPKSCTQEQRNKFEQLLLHFVGLEHFLPQPPAMYGKSTDLILTARTSVQVIRTNSGLYSQRVSQASQEQHKSKNTNQTQRWEEKCEGKYGRRIGAGIKAGGELIRSGLEFGAIGTANAIHLGASCLKDTLPKEQHVREIPATVVNGVVLARETTGRVVDLSASLLAMLGGITANFASLTACYIRATASPLWNKLVETSGVSPTSCNKVVVEVSDLGEGIAEGAWEAYIGLENAARILAHTLQSETCDVVEHCYGSAAARILQGAGQVVGNVVMSGLNAGEAASPQAAVRKTVRKTGLALINEECVP